MKLIEALIEYVKKKQENKDLYCVSVWWSGKHDSACSVADHISLKEAREFVAKYKRRYLGRGAASEEIHWVITKHGDIAHAVEGSDTSWTATTF